MGWRDKGHGQKLGSPSLGGIYDNQKPFTQHSSNAGPAAFLNVKEETKKMRAAWGSFGDRRQITLCCKLSCHDNEDSGNWLSVVKDDICSLTHHWVYS